MRFSRTWALAVDPQGVRARSVDAGGRRASFVRDGSSDVEVTVTGEGTTTVVTVGRAVATGVDGPGVAVVGRHLRLVQTERWSAADARGAVGADLEIAFPGRPITVTARIDVTPAPRGSTHTVTGRVTVRLPGIGRLIERRVVESLLTAMDEQLQATGRATA